MQTSGESCAHRVRQNGDDFVLPPSVWERAQAWLWRALEQSTLRRVKASYVVFHARADFKIRFVALIGAIGFPGYYVVWKYLFPQPYESVGLRTTGFILCTALALGSYWPSWLRRFYLGYSYFALMYALPVFFTTMLLLNGANTVWLMSAMAGLVFMMLLYDRLNLLIVGFLGSIVGVALFWLIDGLQPLPVEYYAALPVFAFAALGVAFLSYSESVVASEKLSAANVLASNIAHEMRTPLLGIRLDCERIQESMPRLVEPAIWAYDHGFKGPAITGCDAGQLDLGLRRIAEHTAAANLVIDMLLLNVDRQRVSPENGMDWHSMTTVVAKALDRYHFKPGDRTRVGVLCRSDFEFFGSDVLMAHVLFNLLKNAFRSIDEKGDGQVTIEIDQRRGDGRGYLLFADTGTGVDREMLSYLFIPFLSGKRRQHGTGIGLAFCKSVIESFGGSITCRSSVGQGTEFTISLAKRDVVRPTSDAVISSA